MSHQCFSLSRQIAAPPARVFDCWADPDKKRAWFVDSDGPAWGTRSYELDFRVGGRETGRFELKDGPGAGLHENVTHYLAIRPGERIDFAYTMAMDGRVHSASLVTVDFTAVDGGTLVTFTESISTIGESDGAAGRQGGWGSLLDHLAAYATREPQDA